jgi:hypothetical protein
MMGATLKFFAVTLLLTFLPSHSFASSPVKERSFDDFFSYIEGDPAMDGAWYLEVMNALGEWERVILVFGFAGAGDASTCATLAGELSNQHPNAQYRCMPRGS